MKRKLLLTSFLAVAVVSLSSCNLLPSISSSNPISSSSSSTSSSISTTVIKSEYVNLVAANDIHGRLVSQDGEYGLDALSSKLKEIEKEYGEFIKIANGDIFQGKFESNVLYGRPMVDCLNAMDFDAFVIGNHEFDWGLDKIAAYKDGDFTNGEADFPFLSCNIAYKSNNQLLEWAEPYTIVENGGNKVGIIGAIGSQLTRTINAGMVKDYVFLDSVSQISKYATEIRTNYDVDYVVLAIHDHTESVLKQIGNLSGDSKIDAIFTAHTHQKENLVVGNNIPVLQGGGNNKNVSIIRLKHGGHTKRIESLNSVSDPEIKKIIDGYVKGEIEVRGNEVIGYNSNYKNSGAMGSLLANTMKNKFGTDVGITNYARTGLDAGDITIKEMYEVYPFDNMILTATISGKLLRSFVNYAYSIYYDYEFSLANIEDERIYTIAIIDYVYDNEKNTSYFSQNPEIRVEQNIYMRDFMIDYIKEVKNI